MRKQRAHAMEKRSYRRFTAEDVYKRQLLGGVRGAVTVPPWPDSVRVPFGPVSYTHLDVYKRQAPHGREPPRSAGGTP